MLVAAACIACGGSGGSDAAPTAPPTTVPAIASGQGSITLGTDSQDFTVTSCTDGPGPDDTPQATLRFRLVGNGTADGVDYQVDVSRYTSDTGVGGTTITETAKIVSGTGEAAEGIQAKRTSIDGTWLDLNARATKTPLIVRRGTLVEVLARFGPEGSVEGDKDLVLGHLLARCP